MDCYEIRMLGLQIGSFDMRRIIQPKHYPQWERGPCEEKVCKFVQLISKTCKVVNVERRVQTMSNKYILHKKIYLISLKWYF